MVELTRRELVTLRDILDIEIDAFEGAMHDDTEQSTPKTLEELLSRAASYGNILQDLRSIRKKVSGDSDRGGAS